MAGKQKYNPLLKFGFETKGSEESPDAPTQFKPKTTAEIFAIVNPNVGDAYYNTTEEKIVYYTLEGWRLLVGDEPLQSIIYENNFDNGNGGVSLVNGNGQNVFIIGDKASFSGTHSLYISRNGSDPIYNKNKTSRNWAEFFVDIPAGATNIYFTFVWKGEGEHNYDFMRIRMYDENGNNGVIIGKSQYGSESDWQFERINIDSIYAGTRRKFQIEWNNDSNTGSQPPIIIDDIKIKANL